MNMADRLRAEMDELESCESHDLDQDFTNLERTYSQRVQHPQRFHSLTQLAEGALLGNAAYALGVHYVVQDKLDPAEYWLRIAAEHDIGDAALRLAHLCEIRSVQNFNTAANPQAILETAELPTSTDPKLEEARYWYSRAELAGYSDEWGDELEQSAFSLDCCAPMVDFAAEERAERMIEEAKKQAREEAGAILRRARADVQVVVDEARVDVERLALQRQQMTEEVDQLRAVLRGLAGLLGTQPRPEGRIRSLWYAVIGGRSARRSSPAADGLDQDLAAASEILMGFPLPEQRLTRPMIATMVTEVQQRMPRQAMAEATH
ncbi:hypothetical protein [Catellatospora chokoriensis]|uniref:Uncharacterized protein n=1 Tax=Catellatospora chokoriensis TaxID=310353 RepID=A0A8J3JV90_9ACTN|nr:hypothetical protein [Catellatospora chokoriensis]GIF89144.1 hypothetical protein Cch02nite_25880 [Catellatospora chokoriensis]